MVSVNIIQEHYFKLRHDLKTLEVKIFFNHKCNVYVEEGEFRQNLWQQMRSMKWLYHVGR